MQKNFWLERWERDEIGFHEKEVNAYLSGNWHELHAQPGEVVFVPLCGKSVDMRWLRERGYPVLGVELSELAAQAFFRENVLDAKQSGQGRFRCYEANDVRILCGDFFGLRREDMAGVKAVYDRASMVALPPDMRKQYASHMAKILRSGTQILLVAFDYPQQEMPGPPFAVSAEEVDTLYDGIASVRLLQKVDVLAQNPRFQKRGLTRLQESVYLLTLK